MITLSEDNSFGDCIDVLAGNFYDFECVFNYQNIGSKCLSNSGCISIEYECNNENNTLNHYCGFPERALNFDGSSIDDASDAVSAFNYLSNSCGKKCNALLTVSGEVVSKWNNGKLTVRDNAHEFLDQEVSNRYDKLRVSNSDNLHQLNNEVVHTIIKDDGATLAIISISLLAFFSIIWFCVIFSCCCLLSCCIHETSNVRYVYDGNRQSQSRFKSRSSTLPAAWNDNTDNYNDQSEEKNYKNKYNCLCCNKIFSKLKNCFSFSLNCCTFKKLKNFCCCCCMYVSDKVQNMNSTSCEITSGNFSHSFLNDDEDVV